MNGEVTPQNNQANKNPVLSILGIGLFEIIFVVVCFFLIFGTLNYFNILSVSDAFPKYLGWLPHKSGQTQQRTSSVVQISPTPVIKPTLNCTVPKEFCGKEKEITMGNSFYGVGLTLSINTPIYAVFSGRVEEGPKPTGADPKQSMVFLKDNKGNEAIYTFYGKTTVSIGSEVTSKSEIGKIGAGNFPSVEPFTGLNYFLSLKQEGKFQKLSSQDFKN